MRDIAPRVNARLGAPMGRPNLPPVPDYRALHDRMGAMGLTVMSYQHRAEGGWWVPRDIAGPDLALILWREAGTGNYGFDGWAPQLGPHRTGGRYQSLGNALGWLQRARDVRDGKAADFGGV